MLPEACHLPCGAGDIKEAFNQGAMQVRFSVIATAGMQYSIGRQFVGYLSFDLDGCRMTILYP